MSLAKPIQLRESYIEGWYQMTAERLVGATVVNFIFDDPAEAEPVNREMLPGFKVRLLS